MKIDEYKFWMAELNETEQKLLADSIYQYTHDHIVYRALCVKGPIGYLNIQERHKFAREIISFMAGLKDTQPEVFKVFDDCRKLYNKKTASDSSLAREVWEDDLAIWIDRLIPDAYRQWKNEVPEGYHYIEPEGLRYQFEVNWPEHKEVPKALPENNVSQKDVTENEPGILVFDVETANKCQEKICSIGYALIKNNVIVDTGEHLINPECCFHEDNVKIHQIIPIDVQDSPTFPEVWSEIRSMFYNNIVTGYNIRLFDLYALGKTLQAYGIQECNLQFFDTQDFVNAYYSELPNRKLQTVAEAIGFQYCSHDAKEDSIACAKVLLNMMSRGLQIDKAIQEFELNGHWELKDHSEMGQESDSCALLELKILLTRITADGKVDMDEFAVLSSWISAHENLKGRYPYDTIYEMLQKILEDGRVEEAECRELLQKCLSLLDPVNSHLFDLSTVKIQGSNIVHTGDFDYGNTDAVEELIKSHGGIIKSGVSKKTNIVAVGAQGSKEWAAGNYGRKIQRAMELRLDGIDIQIIPEKEFMIALENENASDELDQISFDDLPMDKEPETLVSGQDELENAVEYKSKVTALLDAIIQEESLPENSLQLKNSTNNKGEIIPGRYQIIIFEPEYPPDPNHAKPLGTTKPILTLQEPQNQKDAGKVQVIILTSFFDEIDLPETAIGVADQGQYRSFRMKMDDNAFLDYLKKYILYRLSVYQSGARAWFGCCSAFMECSDAKKCVHQNKLYATNCSYRKNLDAGRIFYGKNRNID